MTYNHANNSEVEKCLGEGNYLYSQSFYVSNI